MTRTRVCPACRSPFSFEIEIGAGPKYCTDACRSAARTEAVAERRRVASLCRTPECQNKASRKNGLCESCYVYEWRTGKARDPKRKAYKLKYSVRTNGVYRIIKVPGHPLADSNGNVYHHRLIAFAKHNGVCPPCHWCEEPLEWKRTHIDHLNETKADNRPENLVVACCRCNRARGALLGFIRALSEVKFDELVGLMRSQVKGWVDAAQGFDCNKRKAIAEEGGFGR